MRPEHWFYTIPLRFRSLFRRAQSDHELDAELREHIEQKTEDYISKGLAPKEARRQALLELRGIEQTKEACRDTRRVTWLQDFGQDIRYAARMLSKAPGFTAAAVLTLAFGIGANATIFTFINELLLRPPSGVSQPNRLISVWNRLPDGQMMQFSYPDYLYFRDHNQVFSSFVAFNSDPTQASWTQRGQSSLIYVRMVSANFFPSLGVGPLVGRGFLPNEDVSPGNNPVIVLSHKFWQERLGADPSILGKTLTLNTHTFTVIGIAPANFEDVRPEFETDVWAPISMQAELEPGSDFLTDRQSYWIFVVGRLKPGFTRAQAQANVSLIASQLQREHPDPDRKDWGAVATLNSGIDPGGLMYVDMFSALLMVLVGLVLLIACANAANLLLARASTRWREMTIRVALGAKRSRILRLVLTESVLLALMAGGVGILFSVWSGQLILTLKPSVLSFLNFDLPLDWRVLGFTLLISTLTGLIFGLAPALHCSKVDVAARLKDESLGSKHKSRFRNALVIGQVAVCLVLLIGASLCVRSLLNARSIDPGFAVQNRLAVNLDLRVLGYTDEQSRSFYLQLVDRVRVLPGVRSASMTDYLPLGFESTGQGIQIEGRSPEQNKGLGAGAMSVGPAYFRTMGIPLLHGREFTDRDTKNAPPVVIANEGPPVFRRRKCNRKARRYHQILGRQADLGLERNRRRGENRQIPEPPGVAGAVFVSPVRAGI